MKGYLARKGFSDNYINRVLSVGRAALTRAYERGLNFDVLRERYLLWLGNTDGRWEPTGPKRGRVLSEGELLFDNYELQEASDEGLDALRLDSYIDLYRGFQVTTLASERGVFGFATRNTMSESVRTDVLKTRLDRARIVRTTGVLQSVIGTVTSLTNYAHVMNGFWTPDMHDLLLKTYIGFASDFDARVEKTLVSGGLVEVFEGDPDQVRNVAAISLGASAELSPEGLAELSDVPLDPSAAIRRLRASWPVDSYPLASTGPDGFLASVI